MEEIYGKESVVNGRHSKRADAARVTLEESQELVVVQRKIPDGIYINRSWQQLSTMRV